MDAKARGHHDLATEVQKFRAQVPDRTAGETAAGADLDATVTAMDDASSRQLSAIADRHNSTATKQALRTDIEADLRHLNRVGQRVRKEVPDTELKIGLASRTLSFTAFVHRARAVHANAVANQELLVKFGLSETVLTELGERLDRLQQAIDQGQDARQAHVTASAGLDELDRKVVRIVWILDSLYRARFRDDPVMLSKWESATRRFRTHARARSSAPDGTAPDGTAPDSTPPNPPSGTDVRPAA
jgi:hypothetical protein